MWKLRDPNFQAPNGEKLSAVYDRIARTILHIVENNRNKTICIVSHGCAIVTFMAWAKGLSVEQVCKMKICDNTAVNKLTFNDNLKPTIEWQNDISHLGEELRTYAMALFEHKEG